MPLYPPVSSGGVNINARYSNSSTVLSGTTVIAFSTLSFDTNSAYNTTTGIYTIPTTGKYMINAALEVSATFAVTNNVLISIEKNGSLVSAALVQSGGAQNLIQASISDLISFTAGDTMDIALSSGGTSPTIAGASGRNYFSIFYAGS